MQGVVGGISPRGFDSGQSPTSTPDQISANTTILQTGAGGFARLSTALQVLNQSANVAELASQVGTNTGDISTINGEIATINGRLAGIDNQIALINQTLTTYGGYITALQGQVATLQTQVATNTSNIATNTANIATNAGNITTLQGQVGTLQTQVAGLQLFMNSFSYLQTEVSTNTLFLDQRTIYKRSFVINGALNNPQSNFVYPHGVVNINYVVNVQAMAAQAGGAQYPITFLNMATAPSLSTGLSIWADTTNIVVSVGTTTFTGVQVLATLWYTATDR